VSLGFRGLGFSVQKLSGKAFGFQLFMETVDINIGKNFQMNDYVMGKGL